MAGDLLSLLAPLNSDVEGSTRHIAVARFVASSVSPVTHRLSLFFVFVFSPLPPHLCCPPTPPLRPVLPTSQLSNKSISRQVGKSASRQALPPPASLLRLFPHPRYARPCSRGAPPERSPYPPGRPNKGVTPSYPVENVQCNRQRQMPGTPRTCRPGNQRGRALSSKTTRTLRALRSQLA